MTSDRQQLDPVYLNARREALIILAVFAVCFTWAILVYFFDGYTPIGKAPPDVTLVLGMPRWVFWGIFVPWIFADVVTLIFALFVMRDDDLGESAGEEQEEEK